MNHLMTAGDVFDEDRNHWSWRTRRFFFGARLAHAGNDVTFIARGATLEALRANGVKLKSKTLGDLSLLVQTTDNSREVGPVELVILYFQYYDLDMASETVKSMIGGETIVLSAERCRRG